MGLLLLLSYTLLSTYFQPGKVENAQQIFSISSVTLSIEPQAVVPRNTNVTIRCKAKVLTSGSETLTLKYSLEKDDNIVDSKTTTSMEDFSYPLINAKVSSNGMYKCLLSIGGQQGSSEKEKLTVEGVSNPVLHLNPVLDKTTVVQGEELTFSCLVPDETGSIYVYFFDNDKEIVGKQMSSHRAEFKHHLKEVGNHSIHCLYMVRLTPDNIKSEKSNVISITVKELSISPVLKIYPDTDIYEGDPLNIACTTRNFQRISENVSLTLSVGSNLLGRSNTSINYNMTAPASISNLTFECWLTVKNVHKCDKKSILVTELFSEPTLTMVPPEVFQRDLFTLVCRSERVAPEKLKSSDLTYSLHSLQNSVPQKETVFPIEGLLNDFNYTCVAQARNVMKQSKILTVRPKILVSTPEISSRGHPILGQSFQILCWSFNGSKPITYTLFKEDKQIDQKIIYNNNENASFTVKVNHPGEMKTYSCEASNKNKQIFRSKALNVSVIVPTSNVTLSTVPDQQNLVEGSNLHLICTVRGTPPITFTWRLVDVSHPLNTTTSEKNHEYFEVPVLSKRHSGQYFCEAFNLANTIAKSPLVNIEVQMALWKKGLITGVVLLVVALLILVGCVMYFKSKRGQRQTAAELSVKPSSPKSDDSLKAHLTHDTDVYKAVTVRVKGATVCVLSEQKTEADYEERESSVFKEPDVEYTEVVHPRSADPARVPLKKGTDTVYSELQNSTHSFDKIRRPQD